MAIDNRLQVFNEEDQPVDYDILASDVKFNDGKDLPTKLAEMETQIGEGGYTPPEGGIPKADLAPSVQTSLGLADTALQDADKTQLQSAINAVQTALNNLMNGQSVTDAIDTFNEVVTFLNGIDTDDPTLANQLLALNNAITALQNTLSTKVNSSDLQNYATKSELTSGLSSKQNTLTFDTTPTTGHTTQVMSSDSIKTALDEKADADSVPTITQMTEAIDEAFNDAVVRVLDGETGVLDTLSSESQTDPLSANMGKRLKAAILTLYYSLNNFCFANTRPQLIFDGSTTVDYNVTYVQQPNISYGVNPPSSVEFGNRLEITVETASNLYVIDDDNVIVTMNGQIITNAWNPTTRKVVIPAVIGHVLINVQAMSYVDADGADNKLAFMLDCKNGLTLDGNGVPTKWEDTIGGIEFDLSNVTIGSDGSLVFNGSNAKGVASGGLNVGWENATIEVVGTRANNTNSHWVLSNNVAGAVCVRMAPVNNATYKLAQFATNSDNMTNPKNMAVRFSDLSFALSATKEYVIQNGSTIINYDNATFDYNAGVRQFLSVGYVKDSSNNEGFANITLKAIRVYKVPLDAQERERNYNIDKIRFNLQ